MRALWAGCMPFHSFFTRERLEFAMTEEESYGEELYEPSYKEVDEDVEYRCPEEFDSHDSMKKIFVAGLDWSVTDDELKEFFSEFGEVDNISVSRKESGKPKTFGFVTFKLCDDVDRCLQKKQNLNLKGSQLDVKRAIPKGSTSDTAMLKTKQLYLSNVTPSLTEEQVRSYLIRRHPPIFGTIESIELKKKTNDDGVEVNRGFGFITVSSEDFADRIAIGEESFNIGGMSRPQQIQKARPKEQGTSGGYSQRGRSQSGPRGRGGHQGGWHRGYESFDDGYYDDGYGGYDYNYSDGYAQDEYGGGYGRGRGSFGRGRPVPRGGGYHGGGPRGGQRYQPY